MITVCLTACGDGISTDYAPPTPTPPPPTATPAATATATPTPAAPTPTPTATPVQTSPTDTATAAATAPPPTEAPTLPLDTDRIRDVPSEYRTIQSAIDAAADGDLVRIAAGLYREDINLSGKTLDLWGEAGAAATRLEGTGQTSTVLIVQEEGAGTRLRGLTISAGVGWFDGVDHLGGALYIEDAALTLEDCILSENTADYGGGLAAEGATLTLRRVQVWGNGPARYGGGLSIRNSTVDAVAVDVWENTADRGAGLYVFDSSGEFTNSRWSNNRAEESGGALEIRYTTELLTISNNTLTGNRAPRGSGIYFNQSELSVVSNIIVDSLDGAAMELDSSDYVPIVQFNDVWNNPGGNWGGAFKNLTGRDGNISEDPRFSSYTTGDNVFDDLLSLEEGSPCIDAGPSEAAWNDPDNSRNDLGMYGGPEADPRAYGDADADGLPDLWEVLGGLDPSTDDSQEDADNDGLTNAQEYELGTGVQDPDTDNDGALDGDEVAAGQDPHDPSDNVPVADAGKDFYTEPGEVTSLDGRGSWDPNSDALSYEWTLALAPEGSALTSASIQNPDQARPSFTPDQSGGYVFELRVSDGRVWSAPDSVTVVTAGVIYVPGPDTPTIQSGIDKASAGQRVLVGPGTYVESLDYKGKSIRVESVSGPDVTFLQGPPPPERTALAVFNDRETPEAQLVGFTLSGGTGRYIDGTVRGGAILVTAGTPTIEGCVFIRNAADDGGAVAVLGGGLIFRNNIVRENRAADDGAGIYLQEVVGTVVIEDNVFESNQGNSAGIYAVEAIGTLRNNLFYGNTSEATGGNGGIVSSRSDDGLRITNNLFVQNQAAVTGITITDGRPLIYANIIAWGIAGQGVYIPFGLDANGQPTTTPAADPDFAFNDVVGNEGGEYGGAATWLAGEFDNLSVDPDFVDFEEGDDPARGNFYLMPQSPLVDAGPPDNEFNDPDGSQNDIGLYGGPGADLSGQLDTDHDGMPDWWEEEVGLDPLTWDATADPDQDSLNNGDEWENSSDPNDPDTDDDGVTDGEEIAAGTNPTDPTDSLPVALVSQTLVSVTLGESALLDGSLSRDPQGDTLTWAWTLKSSPPGSQAGPGSFSSPTEATTYFTADTEGDFFIELVVSDGRGQSTPAPVTVRVRQPITVPGDFPDVQAAIDAASDGDRILVGPGTWPGDLDVLGKALMIESTDGPEHTVLQGSGLGAVVSLRTGEPREALLRGFTVRGGTGYWQEEEGLLLGGGLYLEGASPTLEDLIIEDNSADRGGGLFARGGAPRLRGCVLRENLASQDGGGLLLISAQADVAGVQVISNRAALSAGLAVVGGEPSLYNLIVMDNRASGSSGVGGVDLRSCGAATTLANTSVVGNTGRAASSLSFTTCPGLATSNIVAFGASGPGVVVTDSILPLLEFNNVVGHAAGNYLGGGGDLTGSAGNLSADPLFVLYPATDNSEPDLHLSPGSPSTDRGEPSAAQADPDGSRNDQGAWGGPLSTTF